MSLLKYFHFNQTIINFPPGFVCGDFTRVLFFGPIWMIMLFTFYFGLYMRNSFMSFAHYWFVRVSVDLNNWRMLNSVRDQRRLNLARRMAVRKRTGNACLLCRTSKAKCSIFRPCSRFLHLQTVFCHNLQDKFADRNQAMQIQAALYVYNEQKGPSSAFRNFRAPPLSAAEVLMSPSSGSRCSPSMQHLMNFWWASFLHDS